MAEPHVFGVASGVNFPDALVDALIEWSGGNPAALGQMTVFLNADRMRRAVRSAFGQKGAFILPRLLLVTEVDAMLPPGAVPAAKPALRQRLELAQLVQALIDRDPTLAPRASAYDLADSLAALSDEMAVEGVSAETVAGLDVADESGHWQRSLAFLNIVRDFLDASQSYDIAPGARIRMAVQILTKHWMEHPPKGPVIVAGSTGSRGTTAELIKAVGSLPQGKIVFPGFDSDTPGAVFSEIQQPARAEDHPQARIAALLSELGVCKTDVQALGPTAPSEGRNQLVSLALRPAPVTHQWLTEGPKLGDISGACSGMTLIEADSPRQEAEAIGLVVRQAVEDGQSIAVITPDRMLTRQIEAALQRWRIEPDDSAGKPLHLSPPGRLIRLISQGLGQDMTPLALINLLTHPLASTGSDRGPHLLATRKLELKLRRKGMPVLTRQTLPDLADQDVAADWSDWVGGLIDMFVSPVAAPLAARLEQITSLSAQLAAGPNSNDSSELWLQTAGREVFKTLEKLENAADAVPVITIRDTLHLLETALSAETVRNADVTHPNVMVWGTLEARVQGADIVVLAGLNEGIWPAQPAADPWLNRRLRQSAGLLLPDRQIGLSAHDFQQAMGAAEVVITRAKRDAEAETVPSRWLNRILNLLKGLPKQGGEGAVDAMRLRGRIWVKRADLQDRPSTLTAPVPRPAPAPPAAARPRTVSITDIGRLIRDPYAVYARRVLQLRPINPLVPLPDAAVRGTALHRIMERFVKGISDGTLQPEPSDLIETSQAVLDVLAWPATAALWHARIVRIADVFAAAEVRRRSGVTQSLVEEDGKMSIPGTPVQLIGKADRVDLHEDGQISIFDYKSGGVKTAKEMHHFEPQLLLEAVIAEAGGFKELGERRVSEVGYISLGRDAKANAFALEEGPDYDFRAPVIRDRLSELLQTFMDEDQGYTARRAMARVRFEGDYDHLARTGEWDDTQPALHLKVGR